MNRLLSITALLLSINAAIVSAQDFAKVFPSNLTLSLGQGEVTVEQVSLTILPLCFRPYNVDVVASDPAPAALVTNLTGVLLNGCGGDTSTFDIEFTGTGAPQRFELRFVDAEFGSVLGSIPVTIHSSTSSAEPLLGLLTQRRGILFQVASNGCTTKHNFKVEVLESNPLQVRLIRRIEDPCDRFLPQGTRIRFTYRELGIQRGERMRIVNPLGTVQVPHR